MLYYLLVFVISLCLLSSSVQLHLELPGENFCSCLKHTHRLSLESLSQAHSTQCLLMTPVVHVLVFLVVTVLQAVKWEIQPVEDIRMITFGNLELVKRDK